MPLEGDFYRYLHSWFGNKPSRFGWVIKDKLAASGRLMRPSQLAWAIKNGIMSVVTIRESPLDPAWFPKELVMITSMSKYKTLEHHQLKNLIKLSVI